MKILATTVVILVFAGCASNPKEIEATDISPLEYKDFNCEQIAAEIDYVEERTLIIYERLKSEREADNWQLGLGLVLFWPALLFLEAGDGPEAREFAQLKGEYEALRITSAEKKCSLDIKSPEEIIKEAEELNKAAAKEAGS